MTTITGKIENAAGETLHAVVEFESKSTPQFGAGIVQTHTTKRKKSLASDGTFSVQLAAGNYDVSVKAKGKTTTFKIAVPEGDDTVSIEDLVTTAVLPLPGEAPYSVWNGQRAGHLTFIPIADPAAPTVTELAGAGGHITDEDYLYAISYLTQDGETFLSEVTQLTGSGAANRINRITLAVNPSRVTAKRIWRNRAADSTTLYLLAEVPPETAHYDDWESLADFFTRAAQPPNVPAFNTSAGIIYASPGQAILYFSSTGLAALDNFTMTAGAKFFLRDNMYVTGNSSIYLGREPEQTSGYGTWTHTENGAELRYVGQGADNKPILAASYSTDSSTGQLKIGAGLLHLLLNAEDETYNGYILTLEASTGLARWSSPPSTEVSWGQISGTLTDQTDLTGYIATAVADLVAAAPATLDTLNELAAALGDDANFASTMTTALGTKAALAGATFTGALHFSGTTHAGLKLNSLTSTQRDALTPAVGMTIWNTTTTRLEVYNGSAWKTHARLDGDTMTGNLSVPLLTVAASANANALAVTGYSVTGSGVTAMLDLAGTWNTTGAATGLKLNITNTASDSTSKLFDFQLSGASHFRIDRTGNLYLWNNNWTIGHGSSQDIGVNTSDSFNIGATAGNTLGFNGSSSPLVSADLRLTREAAGILAQRNSTNAQEFRIYNTYTSATSFERLDVKWASNVCNLWTEKGGSGGTARELALGADVTALIRMQSGSKIGFFGVPPITKPAVNDDPSTATVTCLSNLLNALSSLGLISIP